MTEDDILPTEPAPEGAPAESEASEAKKAVSPTDDDAKTGNETDTEAEKPEGEGGDSDAEDDDDEKPKRPSRYQRLKRERDALAAEIAQMRSRPMVAAVDDKATLDDLVAKEIGAPPKEEDFADWFAYERALTAYETEKRIATRDIRRQAQSAQEAARQASQALVQDFQDRQREARKTIADFDKVVSGVTKEVVPHVTQLILESEKGAVIQYHLAKNPDVLDRINGLSLIAAAKEIARLEDRLSLPNPKTATKAAPPINAPKGGASGPVDLSKLSMEEYVALRNKGAA